MEERIDGDEENFAELDGDQRVALGKWFLLNSPPGQVQQVARDVRAVLMDDLLYERAAAEAFPEYNVKNMISLELPDRSAQVLVTKFAEVDRSHYLDPRTAVVVAVDHVKQVCKEVRPARDEELPSAYVEEYRISVDAELLKYVEEAYPGGGCAVYCTCGEDAVGKQGGKIQLTAVIVNSSFSPTNFRGGCWRSVWRIQINEELHSVDLHGQIDVNAHYFEEGNVQLETSHEYNESIVLQNSKDTGIAIGHAIEQLESAFLTTLEEQYGNLSDRTFKELRRKLPVTRVLFAWDKALQLSLSRDLTKEISNKR